MSRDQALQDMLDRHQIGELATRYSIACDARDYDALVELFDPAVDNEKYAKYGTGRDAVRAYYSAILDGGADGSVLHLVANHQIDFVDATNAYGVVYVRAFAAMPERSVDIVAVYLDEYVKRDDRWYFWVRWPYDLQRLAFDEPRSVGDKTLADAWQVHRQRMRATSTSTQ